MPEVLLKYKKMKQASKMANKMVPCAPNYKQKLLH